MCVLTANQLNTQGRPSAALSVELLPLQCVVLITLGALVSPESQLPVLNSGTSGLPLPAPMSGNPPDSQLEQFCRAHFICFLSFRKYLKNHCLIYFVLFFPLLLFGKCKQESKSDTFCSILAGSRRCISILKMFSYILPSCSPVAPVNKWQSSWIKFMYLQWPFFY